MSLLTKYSHTSQYSQRVFLTHINLVLTTDDTDPPIEKESIVVFNNKGETSIKLDSTYNVPV